MSTLHLHKSESVNLALTAPCARLLSLRSSGSRELLLNLVKGLKTFIIYFIVQVCRLARLSHLRV